jgi:hypothetical protein
MGLFDLHKDHEILIWALLFLETGDFRSEGRKKRRIFSSESHSAFPKHYHHRTQTDTCPRPILLQ